MIPSNQINTQAQGDRSVLDKDLQPESIQLRMKNELKTYLENSIRFRYLISFVIFIWQITSDQKDRFHLQEEVRVITKITIKEFKKWLMIKDGAKNN